MSLKSRFLLLSIVFVLLAAALHNLVQRQNAQLGETRLRIEDDWAETVLLLRLEEALASVHQSLEEQAGEADTRALLATLDEVDALAAEVRMHAEEGLVGVAGEQQELEALEDLADALAEWRALLATPASSQGPRPQFLARMNDVYARSTAATAAYRRGALDELGMSLGQLGQSQARIERIVASATLGALLLLAVSWCLFGFWLLRPIRKLRRMVQRVRDQRYDRLERFSAPGELGEVIHSFHEMAEQVHSFTSELEERVRERTLELEESRGRIQLMLDKLPDAVGLSSAQGALIMANPAYHALLSPATASALPQLLQAPLTPHGYRKWVGERGRPRLLEVSTFPLGPGDGGDIVLEHVRDMTHRVESDEALASAQRLVALGRVASGIAHEVNNPLTAIAACAEGLLKRLRGGTPDNEMLEDYLSTIHQEVFRCKQITSRLLDLARPREDEIVACDPSEVIRDVVHLVAPHAQSRGVSIATELAGPVEATTCPRALRQILLNLLLNAVDASHSGGRVVVSAQRRGESLLLSIADDGVGIAAEDLPRIFEPFFTRRRDHSGTGLGLYVCQSLAGALGTTIKAESAGPGKGAHFTLLLPLQRVPLEDTSVAATAHA